MNSINKNITNLLFTTKSTITTTKWQQLITPSTVVKRFEYTLLQGKLPISSNSLNKHTYLHILITNFLTKNKRKCWAQQCRRGRQLKLKKQNQNGLV